MVDIGVETPATMMCPDRGGGGGKCKLHRDPNLLIGGPIEPESSLVISGAVGPAVGPVGGVEDGVEIGKDDPRIGELLEGQRCGSNVRGSDLGGSRGGEICADSH